MKSPTTTLKTTIAALAISAVMVLACSSTDSNQTTEQQSSAAQPIATIQTTSSQAPQEDQPTKEANLDTGSQTSDLPTTANAGSDNPTIERPSFGTATPEASDPVATPTQPLRQQQGGAVILAQPTPTMTPVPTPTSTPLPASTPYWQAVQQSRIRTIPSTRRTNQLEKSRKVPFRPIPHKVPDRFNPGRNTRPY